MRVFCNHDGEWTANKKQKVTTSYFFGFKKVTRDEIAREKTKGPKYGDICTVTKEYFGEIINCNVYELAEWVGYGAYDSRLFIPLTDSEEKESIEEFNERINEHLRKIKI